MKDRRVLLSFARYLLPYWKQEALVLCLLIAGTLTSLTPPYLMKILIDDVFPYKEYDLLMLVLAGLLAAALVGALSMFGVDYLYNWIGNRVMRDIRHAFFAHLMRLVQSFFQQQKTGDVIFRINNDVNQIQLILSASLLRIFDPIQGLHGLYVDLVRTGVSMQRVMDFMAVPTTALVPQATDGGGAVGPGPAADDKPNE